MYENTHSMVYYRTKTAQLNTNFKTEGQCYYATIVSTITAVYIWPFSILQYLF